MLDQVSGSRPPPWFLRELSLPTSSSAWTLMMHVWSIPNDTEQVLVTLPWPLREQTPAPLALPSRVNWGARPVSILVYVQESGIE